MAVQEDALKALSMDDIIAIGARVTLWMPSKHMGNLLVSLATIRKLEEALSGHPLTLVIDETYREIMEAAGLDSTVIYFPRKRIDHSGITGKLKLAFEFILATRQAKTDLAIAIEGDKVSQKFMPLSGSKFSVGPDNKYCKHVKIKLPLAHGQRHVFFDYEAVYRQLTGNAISPGYPLLRASPDKVKAVEEKLVQKLPDPKAPYAIIHPCATKDYKQWPVSYFAAVADYLGEKGVKVIITGAGRFDGETIAKLTASVKKPVLSLHDELPIGEFIALIQSAILYIGNDTGPTHLAAATGIPTFGIFGPTDEFLWGPLGKNAHILRSKTPCEADCLRRRCAVDYRCMQTLTPDEVIPQLESLL